MKMIPPPIITIMKIDMVTDPGSRYWMYGTYGYTSTTSSPTLPDTRGTVDGVFSDEMTLVIVPAIVADTKLSVLSEISAMRGWLLDIERREKSGGMTSTPFTRPLRRSLRATPESA